MSITEFMREAPEVEEEKELSPHERAQAMERVKPYQPTNWTDRHRLVVALKATGLFTNEQIAKLTKFTAPRVSTILNDARAAVAREEFVDAITDQLGDAASILKAASARAARRVVELIDSKDEKIAKAAGFGVLDRTGFQPFNRAAVGAMSPLPPDLERRMLDTMDQMREIKASYQVVKVAEAVDGLGNATPAA